MDSIRKYLYMAITIAFIVMLGYLSYVKNSRDNAINKLDKANEQLNAQIATNKDLKGTIDLLKIEAEQNDRYIRELDKKRKDSESRANELLNRFKNDKRTNQQLSDWANAKLPEGLY